MIGIIAVNNIGYIGKNNKLLWECSEDLKHFKKITTDKKLICGYNTFKTLPNVVKNRTTVILDPRDELFDDIYNLSEFDQSNIICIGGKKTYEKYCKYFSELHISRINDNKIGDCRYPDFTELNINCKIFNYYFEPNI